MILTLDIREQNGEPVGEGYAYRLIADAVAEVAEVEGWTVRIR